jgi:hypothetical protein
MSAKRFEGVDCRSQIEEQRVEHDVATRRGWLALSLMAAPAVLAGSTKPAAAAPAAGTSGQLQYNNNGNLAGTPNVTFQPAAGSNPTVLMVVNENNSEQGDFDPRGFASVENSNTDHSAHFTGWKSRGNAANPMPVQAGDGLAALIVNGYLGGTYQRGGSYSHVVTDVSSGSISTVADIQTSTNGTSWSVFDADTTTTQINGALVVSDPGNNGGQPGANGYASVTLFGSQSGDVTAGWGIFAGYPNPGDFSIRERAVNTYVTIRRSVGDVVVWLGRLIFGDSTSSFPALKRSGRTLQVRLGDDSGFAPIQGKLTTDTAFASGTVTATGHLTLYDSTGKAYIVNASPA